MKRAIVSLGVLLFAVSGAFGAYDISFSANDGGSWSYDGTNAVFEFHQLVGVDLVEGVTGDTLIDTDVYIPDLQLVGITGFDEVISTSYGDVTVTGVAAITIPEPAEIVLKDSLGNDVLTGTLAYGQLVAYGTTAGLYPQIQVDIEITGISNTVGSVFLQSLAVGDVLDFSLSMQAEVDMAAMILDGTDTSGNTFSGGMNVIPEPATLAILGLGSLTLLRRRRA